MELVGQLLWPALASVWALLSLRSSYALRRPRIQWPSDIGDWSSLLLSAFGLFSLLLLSYAYAGTHLVAYDFGIAAPEIDKQGYIMLAVILLGPLAIVIAITYAGAYSHGASSPEEAGTSNECRRKRNLSRRLIERVQREGPFLGFLGIAWLFSAIASMLFFIAVRGRSDWLPLLVFSGVTLILGSMMTALILQVQHNLIELNWMSLFWSALNCGVLFLSLTYSSLIWIPLVPQQLGGMKSVCVALDVDDHIQWIKEKEWRSAPRSEDGLHVWRVAQAGDTLYLSPKRLVYALGFKRERPDIRPIWKSQLRSPPRDLADEECSKAPQGGVAPSPPARRP